MNSFLYGFQQACPTRPNSANPSPTKWCSQRHNLDASVSLSLVSTILGHLAMLVCSCYYSLNQIFCFILVTHIATAIPNNLHSSRLLLKSSVVMKRVSFQNCIQPWLARKPFLFLENQKTLQGNGHRVSSRVDSYGDGEIYLQLLRLCPIHSYHSSIILFVCESGKIPRE
jgi:hypothetical protein